MQREEYLKFMIESVLGNSKVNYKYKNEIATVFKGTDGIIDKCFFKNRSSTQRYAASCKILFELVFVASDVQFNLKYKEGSIEKNLNRKDAVARAIKFLENQGIDFQDLELKNLKMEWILLRIINYFIIPAIFDTGIGDFDVEWNKEKFKNIQYDEIEKNIQNAVEEANEMLLKIRFRNLTYRKIFELKDAKCNIEQCNFAIPLNMEELPIYSHKDELVKWCNISGYATKKIAEVDLKEISIEQEKEISAFEQLTMGYEKYEKGKKLFFSDFGSYKYDYSMTDHETSDQFQVSNCEIAHHFLDEKNFYYITQLSEEIIKIRYPDIKTHEDLHEKIKERANKDLSRQYEKVTNDYYVSIMMNIEDILERIFEMKMSKFAGLVSEDAEYCRYVLSCFNADVNSIVYFLTEGKKIDYNAMLEVYLTIERIVLGFISQLSNNSEILAKEFKSWSGLRLLNTHIQKINEYINNEELNHAIEVQEKTVRKYPNLYKAHLEFFGEEYKYRMPNLFKRLKMVLEKYYNFINIESL